MQNIELLKTMVEIDTTNSKANESTLADFLAGFLKPYAAKIEFVCGGKQKRKNLIAYFGNLNSKNILCFNGHLDVVAADRKAWDTDPFKLEVKDGLAYGRGTADMKGGIAASLQAIIKAKKDGLLQDKLVIFAGSVDEETGADSEFGAKIVVEHLIKTGIKPQGCIIPEPVKYGGNLKVNLGHRGLMWFSCTAKGEIMHSGLLNAENNAVNNMIGFIRQLQKKITAQPTKINGVPGSSVRVVYFEGGNKTIFNKIPGTAIAHLDVRISPQDTNEKMLKTITKIAAAHKVEIKPEKNTPSASITRENKIVSVLENVLKERGENYALQCASVTCDAHWFIKACIPTVNGLGASGENAHAPNEFIELKSLDDRMQLFYQVIKEW